MGMTKTERDAKPRKDVRQDLADALISHIEAGTAPWQKPWDPTNGDDTPINAVTGKQSGLAQLLSAGTGTGSFSPTDILIRSCQQPQQAGNHCKSFPGTGTSSWSSHDDAGWRHVTYQYGYTYWSSK